MYHFVGLRYLPNVVLRNGLWCASQLRAWADTFDNDRLKWGTREKAEAFSDYVSCSVNPPMGMMTPHKGSLLILELDPAVMAGAEVAFIGKRSSFGDVQPPQALAQTGLEWFEKMFLNDFSSRAAPHPGEFLVPRHIALNYLQALIFYCSEDVDTALKMLRGTVAPPGLGALTYRVDTYPFGRKYAE